MPLRVGASIPLLLGLDFSAARTAQGRVRDFDALSSKEAKRRRLRDADEASPTISGIAVARRPAQGLLEADLGLVAVLVLLGEDAGTRS